MLEQLKPKKNKLTSQEQEELFDIIGNFVSTGLTVEESIEAFRADEDKESYIYKLCGVLLRDMQNGHSFSESLAKFPKSFPPFTTGILAMAEGTGQLDTALREISFRQKLQDEISSKVRSATLVPKIAGLLGIAAFLFASMWAIPRMGESLKSVDAELPLITQVVMLFGEFCQSFWWLIFLLIGGSYFGYKWFVQKYPEKMANITLHIPFWRPITINQVRYDFCTVTGLCIEAGIEPVQALNYTAMATDNLFLKRLIKRSLKHISSTGMPFDEALAKEDAIPLLDHKLYRMLRAGRTTGRTGDIMKKQAEYYRKKLMDATNAVGDKVGMVVISPIYALVAILVTALVLPILNVGINAATQAM